MIRGGNNNQQSNGIAVAGYRTGMGSAVESEPRLRSAACGDYRDVNDSRAISGNITRQNSNQSGLISEDGYNYSQSNQSQVRI